VSRIVGVSLRVVEAVGYHEPRDAISHDWVRFLSGQGLTPVLIPNVLLDPVDYLNRLNISALLLSNGNNLGPLKDTETRYAGDDVSVERDELERALIDYAIQREMPLLGVCRGMQMINAHLGGTVVRDMTGICGAADLHAGTLHRIRITDKLWRIRLGTEAAMTNSFHRQAVTGATISSQLVPFAWAEPDVVEGVYHSELPIIGVQWHPERRNSSDDIDRIIVESWLQKAG